MSDTTQSKLTSLVTQRQSIVDELKKLTGQRSKARLNGSEFAGGERIDELNRDLQEIDETIALARQIVLDEEDRDIALGQAESIERQLTGLEELRDEYLAEMQELENATTELARVLGNIQQTMPKLASLAMAISGLKDLPDFTMVNQEPRVLARMAEVIGRELGSNSIIAFTWASYRMAPVDYDKLLTVWADDEARRFSNLLGTPMFKARKRAEQLRAAAETVVADF